MKRKNTSFVLLSVLILTLFLGVFSVNGLGASTLNFTFEKDSILSDDNPEFYSQETLPEYVNFNVRNATELTQIYNATYSFTNETGLSGTDIPFIDYVYNEGIDYFINISSGINEHDKTLNIIDNSLTAYSENEHRSDIAYVNGSIEFWWLVSNITTTDGSKVAVYETGTELCGLYISGDDLHSYNPGSTSIKENFIIANTWFHVRIELDDSANTFNCYINGILEGDNIAYRNPSTIGINRLRFGSGTNDIINIHYDAIGFSWDGYNANDNMIPITTIENSRKEMDKFEFALEGVNDAFDINDDNPSGWTDVEQSGGDQVNIGSYPADIDKKVLVVCDSSTDTRGLLRDFSVSGEFIEINFTHEYSVLTGTGGTNFYIDSSDDTLIVSLRMLITGEVEWNDGGWNEIFSGLTTSEVYVFNFIISYEMEACIFSYYIDGVYQDTYIFPLMVSGKEGLGTVQMTNQLVTNDEVNFEIDNIGVYVDGISLADSEFSYLTYEIGKNWSYQEQNLFFINASGYFGIYAVDFDVGSYSIPHVAGMGQPLETINSGGTHYDVKVLINLYDNEMTEYPIGINNTFLVFYLSSGNISLNSIDIEGVKLTEGINDYYMDYSYSGLNSDESYFYVESNRLYFTMTLNDVGLEYMEARFNINNILSENRSMSFASDFNGDMHGYLRLNYTDDTSTFIPFPSHATSTSLILPQEKGINALIILITDLDEAHFGVNTGYITEIQLLYFPDVSITIATTSLLDIIVPLMILLIPTFAIYKKFGESAIIPMFMLMSIICFISDLIPVWLFFILMFGSVVMLFTKKKIEGF